MSRALLFVNLLIIILPSSLYAEISPDIKRKLTEATEIYRGYEYEILGIYELGAVETPTYKTQDPVTYLIYGKDTDRYSRKGYLNVVSIGDNGKAINQWSMRKSNNVAKTYDEDLTMKISEKEINSSTPLECSFKFIDPKDYKSFIGLFPQRRPGN